MMLDFHTHAFPPALAQRALEKMSAEAGGLPYHTDGTYEGLAAAALAAGLTHYVILPIAVKPTQMRTVNDTALARQSDTAIQFASIHPLAPDALNEVSRIKDLGFRGIKMHPEYQDFEVDDPAVFRVYQAIGRAGLITVFHAGYDLGFVGRPKAAARKIKHALAFFEGAPVVAAHMGGHAEWMDVLEHLAGLEGLYFDTSFSHTHLPPAAAQAIIKAHGADRILFGSDSPWADMKAETAYVDRLSLTPEDKRKIFFENGAKLLRLTP